VIGVEQWAEIRRMHFVAGLSIKEIVRRTGRDRNTVRKALRSSEPPRYRRALRPSKLDPFREEIQRLLHDEPRLPGQHVRELIAELGYAGGKTILDDYLREVRPLFARRRVYQRTVYRPGELCQFDLWEPSRPVPVGYGQTRRGYVVVACLPYSRVGAGALVFSKEAPDLLFGIGRCLARFGALPQTLVWDREGALHAGRGRPTEPFAGFCGQLRVGWHTSSTQATPRRRERSSGCKARAGEEGWAPLGAASTAAAMDGPGPTQSSPGSEPAATQDCRTSQRKVWSRMSSRW
jgi:transposase